jgi:hypothetical protein
MPKKAQQFSVQEAIEQGESLYRSVTSQIFRGQIPSRNLYDDGFRSLYLKWLENIRADILPQYRQIDGGLFDEARFNSIGGYIPSDSLFSTTYSTEERTAYRLFIEFFSKQLDVLKKIENKTTVYLENGLIWREPKSKLFCQFEIRSKRVSFLGILADAEGQPIKTERLARGLRYGIATLRKEKRMLNTILKTNLKLPDFIVGRKNFGYQINSEYILKKI